MSQFDTVQVVPHALAKFSFTVLAVKCIKVAYYHNVASLAVSQCFTTCI